MQEVKKIVIIGPESTGKSTLSRQLAQHFNAIWCPEYAREYLLRNGTQYTFDDLLTIAKGQLAFEEDYTNKSIEHWLKNGKPTPSPFLFIDTDMYVMKVWCEYVFEKCHPFILEKIVESGRNLYLLANIDLPWTKDELREYPDLKSRKELFHIYKDILVNQTLPWTTISGVNERRLETAISAVRNSLII
jgi:NadR type nicotinamide-nucleotide adenylyltransferase